MQVRVVRDGAEQSISTYSIMVGDVVLVETGDILAADGIIFQGNDIRQVSLQPGVDVSMDSIVDIDVDGVWRWRWRWIWIWA